MKRFDLSPAACLVTCALLALVGCATLGMPAPRDFNDRVSYAYDIAQEGVAMVRELSAAGELTPDDADAALDQLAAYKTAIGVARSAHAVNQSEGEAKLATIRAGLDDLLGDLREREAAHAEQ